MEKQKQKITILRAILIKIAKNIHESSFGEILFFVGTTLIIFTITFLLTFPREAVYVIKTILAMQNYIIPKFALSVLIVKNYKNVVKYIKSKIPRYEEVADDQIEGIPTAELIDHLIEVKSFKRDDIENKFVMPRNRYQRLAQKLEEVGVLARGENNSRIFNDNIQRRDLVKMLDGAATSGEIKNFIKKEKNHYTFNPIFTNKKIA